MSAPVHAPVTGLDIPDRPLLASDGQLITQVPGYVKPETFLSVMRYIAEGRYRTQSWESFTRDGESTRQEP